MSLLLPIAKDAVLRKVGDRARRLDRGYVERWVSADLWIADALVQKYGREMRAWKEAVQATLAAITPDELLAACREARPDLADVWDTEQARAKMAAEWARGQAWLERQ